MTARDLVSGDYLYKKIKHLVGKYADEVELKLGMETRSNGDVLFSLEGYDTLGANGRCYVISKTCTDVDLAIQKSILNDVRYRRLDRTVVDPLEIEKVVFNPPATIILWADKTKTVVKCQDGDEFDPEKGMAMAFMKKARGNTGAYNKEIDKWVKPYEEKQVAYCIPNSAFDLTLWSMQLEQLKQQLFDTFGIPKKLFENTESKKPTLKAREKEVIETTKNDIPDEVKEAIKEVERHANASEADE